MLFRFLLLAHNARMKSKIGQFIEGLKVDLFLSQRDFSELWQKCFAFAMPRFAVFVRHLHNWLFVRRTQKRKMSYSGCELDKQQIEAVVACEDAQLVLASAGSGKTLSLLAKISYIHNRLGIPAEQILAISFTRKTVEELRERCDIEGVDFQTFHALGNCLLNYGGDAGLGRKRLIFAEESSSVLRDRIVNLCLRDESFARELNDFILFYYSVPQNPGVITSHAARVGFNRICLTSKDYRSKTEQLVAL